jgi:hypothetical protein
MPLLFVVSGAGIWYAFGRRTASQFVKERFIRLIVPLIFGVLVIVPPQVYLERLAQGVHFDSYIDFYPHFFDGHIFAGGNFTPNHLWFLYTLFFCCILALPLIVYFKSSRGEITLNRIANLLASPGGVYTLMIPLYLALILLNPYGKEYVFEFHQLVLVIAGFLMVSKDQIMQAIESQRRKSLLFAIIGIPLAIYCENSSTQFSRWVFYLPNVLGYFSLLLAIFGYARRYLCFSNEFIEYTNKAVYPFYIIHQTITVILAYHIVQLEMNLWIKFFLTSLGTGVLTLLIYHYAVRPFGFIYPFFGLKKSN